MKLRITCVLLLACATRAAWAQLQLMPEAQPAALFAGPARQINARFHNPGSQPTSAAMRLRLYQATSATVAPWAETPWKQLELLSGQTVLESAPVNFPSVIAQTAFLVQWVAGSNHLLGATRVLVYPTNLLDEIKPLLKGADLALLDPTGALKPVLVQNGVAVLDLGEKNLDDFSGKLAIIGPFQSRSQMRDDLALVLKRIAQRGTPVVWILPPPDPAAPLTPSFYLVPTGKAPVVVLQSDLIADFAENPKAQLNLIHVCRLALNPAPWSLPSLSRQP